MPRLDIRIVGARGLPDVQTFGTIDPFCTVELEHKRFQTATADNTENPQWNEVFKFNVADADASQLMFSVWNDNKVSDDFLGCYPMSIAGLDRGQVEEKTVLLQQCKSNAELTIRVMAVDFGDVQEEETPYAPPRQKPQGGLPPQMQAQYAQQQQQQQQYFQQAPPQQFQAPPPPPARVQQYPPQQGYPPQGQPGYPPQGQPGYPPQQQPGYPPQQQPGYPPQQQPGYPPQQQPGYPPQGQPGYPPQQQQPPPQQAYPPQQQQSYPAQPNTPPQDNWKWCNRCSALTYASEPKPCPGGGLHDHGGSGAYLSPFRQEYSNASAQEGWRWCCKCHGLCFQDGEGKPCPGGGYHSFQGSGAYVAHTELGGEPTGAWPVQKGWRYCQRCSVMHFAGSGLKPCAAGGVHTDVGSGAYFTLHIG